MILRVKATPNASANVIIGWEDEPMAGRVLKVRIHAPAQEGKANKALRDFLAKQLGLSKSQVLLEKGQCSRIKSFEIPDETDLSHL